MPHYWEKMKEKLQNKREDYRKAALHEADMHSKPLEQFKRWYSEYETLQKADANAMTLATVDAEGKPRARIVLLKGLDQGGFEFYTNYQSAKAQDLDQNPHAALSFFWPELERQIRIEGKVQKMTAAESDAYFYSRPRGSRIGAWVSPQSETLENRAVLENRLAHFQARFPDKVPRPEHWGGYRLMPHKIEFWQGRPNRLHDRLVYQKEPEGWVLLRLAP